jgi:nucleoside phosphorylase
MTEEKTSHADVAILTMKAEEFGAALEVFSQEPSIFIGPESLRQYNLRSTSAGGSHRYRLALVRLVDQGNGEALDAARDACAELRPALILLVGIAGAVPCTDLTLGDVMISLRVNDYTLHALKDGTPSEYAINGWPVETALARFVVNLQARQDEMGDWNGDLPDRPALDLAKLETYGPPVWQTRVRESIEHHFTQHPRARPKQIDGTLASSDALVKATDALTAWLATARDTRAIDMESAGVYRGTRGRCPMLTIRAMSDVVGLKRDESWVPYACAAAARFARAFLSIRPVEPGQMIEQQPNLGPAAPAASGVTVHNHGAVGQQIVTNGPATFNIAGTTQINKAEGSSE